MAHHSPEVASNAIMSSGQGNCEDSTAMSSEDEDWETITPDGGAEDGGLVDGPDDAQLAHLSTAPVMGWHTFKTIFSKVLAQLKLRTARVADGVVMDQTDELLDEGGHLHINNWYTTANLAERLLHKNTHLTE
ncbi:hypothetical protein KIN20_013961 [Parelaphostrongylus tenuis]|uniref:PiggyBac transposable element-derived protein domain-containing protein n=1 Tax=Parelaphostrongylus tenuis TaxID=148309 RepID=A0AAD5MCW8_PARTN|nr:hypothetical protein KIN20_013961 [Parelaphostrongylus tenuis]